MKIEEKAKWVRAPNFQKYFSTNYGITRTDDIIRLDFGNEQVQFSEEETAYVSECQVIMDMKNFNVFFEMLKRQHKKYQKKGKGRK